MPFKTVYTAETHRQAFQYWLTDHSSRRVALRPGMPSYKRIQEWSGDYPRCACPWHRWEERKAALAHALDGTTVPTFAPSDPVEKPAPKTRPAIAPAEHKAADILGEQMTITRSLLTRMLRFLQEGVAVKDAKGNPVLDPLTQRVQMVPLLQPKSFEQVLRLLLLLMAEQRDIEGLRPPTPAIPVDVTIRNDRQQVLEEVMRSLDPAMRRRAYEVLSGRTEVQADSADAG